MITDWLNQQSQLFNLLWVVVPSLFFWCVIAYLTAIKIIDTSATAVMAMGFPFIEGAIYLLMVAPVEVLTVAAIFALPFIIYLIFNKTPSLKDEG